jgi:2-methylcitrate dehydratase PrpD
MQVDYALEARFPAEALARVILKLKDGRLLESDVHNTSGDPQTPHSDDALNDKFMRLVQSYFDIEQAENLRDTCWNMTSLLELKSFLKLLQ